MTRFKKGDIVSAYCEELQNVSRAVILDIKKDKNEAYIHFVKQDKRLDKWESISELSHIPSTSRNRNKNLYDEDEAMNTPFEKARKDVTRIRNINSITFGPFAIKTWYYSPYPYPYSEMEHLYICEFCFRYFPTAQDLKSHMDEKKEMHPPGVEIYRKDSISIYELSGLYEKVSCQCLCLLSKLFLDHKVLFYDVENFVFYVVCECDSSGAHFVSYFSREVVENTDELNVLACITTLPPYQKRGYGNLCISLAYEIAKRQRRVGGPERPLSDLGKIAFESYWKATIINIFAEKNIESIDDIVVNTAMLKTDIIQILRELNLATKIKGDYVLNYTEEQIRNLLEKYSSLRDRRTIDVKYLIWFPPSDRTKH